MRCFYRYLHKSINLPMAQTSNAIDRRFSTPYYTNTNYSYIKSKPNGAFSAASCFGRSGCWGRGGGVLTAWLGSAYWFGSHCLRRVITPLLFLGEVASAEVFDHLYAYWNWQTNLRGTNSEWWRKKSLGGEKSSTPDGMMPHSTAVFHKNR